MSTLVGFDNNNMLETLRLKLKVQQIPRTVNKEFKIGRLRTTDYGRTRQAIQIVDWREYVERPRKWKCLLTFRFPLRDVRLRMRK